ncbi:MAG: hypothetical protein ACFB21_04270 [Opitutales bacterium]
MTIIPVSKSGGIHLPPEILAELQGADYLQVRKTAKGILLAPVVITPLIHRPEKPAIDNDSSE